MMNIAIFASGRGSNFSAIMRAKKRGLLKANISLLVCDNPKAAVITRAKRARVKVALVKKEDETFKHLKENKIGLIVLAGFMRILSHKFVTRYKGRILNIHPALLPSFKGSHGIEDAFAYGVKVTGVTVHFVDEKTDHGPIILQESVKIEETDTIELLEAKIHKVEHRLYPKAIQLFVEGRLKIKGRRVEVEVSPPQPLDSA